jgi:signal peptidase I
MTAYRHETKKTLVTLLATGAVVFTARTSLADHYFVPSGSMEPTVQVGDHILVNKLAYGVHVPLVHANVIDLPGPRRGDVVVLESPEDGRVLLKRVVALPGDDVAVRDGTTWIDGKPVDDAPARGPASDAHDGGPDFGPTTVPPNHYLVLGDNRGNSKDSRMFGFVAKPAILGRAVGVFVTRGSLTWHAL